MADFQETEVNLTGQQALFQSLLKYSWDIVSILDREGRLLYNSPACERIHGYRPEELLGRSTADLIHPEDRSQVEGAIGWILGHPGEPVTVEYRYSCKDGRWVWMEAVGVNYLDDPSIGGIVSNSRDISDRKKSGQAFREEEERLRLVFHSTFDAIYLIDLETGRYLEVNPAFERITGYSPDQAVGRTSLELDLWFDPIDRDRYYQTLKTEGVVENRLIRIRHAGGREVWAEACSRTMEWQGRPCMVSTARDVTQRIEADRLRQQLEAQVAQTQRMESLGTLAGGLAHEMNNLLAAILGLAEVHRLQQDGTPLGRDMETVIKACHRGGALVRSLLGFARDSTTETRVVDLNALVREQVQLLSRTTLHAVRMTCDLEPGLPPLHGDPAALSSVLMNLCVNGLDALADREGERILHLGTRLSGKEILLEVEDNGTGMPPEVLERALEPFFTTKAPGKGSGLGLSLVHNAVKAHGGRVELQSTPGRGTLVRIGFPVPLVASATEPQRLPVTGGRRHYDLLVVDDDELVRDMLRELVLTLGHRGTFVASGEAAWERLVEGPLPDGVILDLNMPGIGGSATLAKVRDRWPDLPVLLATGRADQKALDLAARHPFVRLVPKPFDLVEIQDHLEVLFRSRVNADPK